MKLLRRQFLHLTALAAALAALPWIARAQTYPTRPITMIVPFAAGGPADAVARIMAERMRQSLGHSAPAPMQARRAAIGRFFPTPEYVIMCDYHI